MKQRYTWLSLLTDVAKGKQPQSVWYRNQKFRWTGDKYLNEKSKDLSGYMGNYATGALVANPMIKAKADILTEAEHKWAEVALAPYRGRVRWLRKSDSKGNTVYLTVGVQELESYGDEIGEIEFATMPRDSWLTGMKSNFDYDPEDLDL